MESFLRFYTNYYSRKHFLWESPKRIGYKPCYSDKKRKEKMDKKEKEVKKKKAIEVMRAEQEKKGISKPKPLGILKYFKKN
jgi:hypothetical protein